MDGPAQPHAIVVNGAELTYLDMGAGEPVIFVHGSTCDFRTWGDHLGPVAERYRAITYSRRSHYPNVWPAEYVACTPELHAADLASLIASLGLGSVHLFGHSYGGLVSLVLASQRPDLVRTLVLGEPPLFSWLETMPQGKDLVAAFMTDVWQPSQGACQRGELEEATRIFIDGVIGDGAYDACPPWMQTQLVNNAAEFCVELASPRATHFSTLTREDVQRVQIPTLLVTGELSPRLFGVISDELARSLSQVEQMVIPGASHDLGDASTVTETVLSFVARHP